METFGPLAVQISAFARKVSRVEVPARGKRSSGREQIWLPGAAARCHGDREPGASITQLEAGGCNRITIVRVADGPAGAPLRARLNLNGVIEGQGKQG